ncbi:hypothetical protein FDF86_04490 [Clostridium botulinum]|nr:hypothetical protein [Clostridium botulinum]
MNNYFIKLPNNLVWSYESGETTLTKDFDKLLVTMCYLDTHVNNISYCCFTLEDLIVKNGFKVRTGKGNSIEQFKSTLLFLQQMGHLDKDLDIVNLKPKEFVSCKYNVAFKQDENENDTEFFRLYYDKFEKIMNSDSKLYKLITLKIYCYTIARMKRNSKEVQEMIDKGMSDDSVIECFYDKYINICKDLDISDNTLTAHVEFLEELELIYHDNVGLVKDEYGSHTANNVYAETKENLKRGLTCSRKYYINKGYTITGKKCSKETNVKKGIKGQIQKQKNENKDTTILEEKLKNDSNVFKDNTTKHKGIRKSCSCMEEDYFEFCRQVEKKDDKAIENTQVEDNSIQEAINNVRVVKVKKKKDKKYVYQSRIIDEYTDAELNDLLSIN